MAKVVFFGTPDYVIPVLEALKGAGHVITAVITQPAKPVGRKKEVTPSPVAKWAEKHGISILTGATAQRYTVAKADVGILASYGRILPPKVLKIFPHGIINVHPSLLPKYRGASPVAAAIAAGDQQTGVTIIRLDEELDHGPMLSQFTEDIKPEDTRGSLRERLFNMGAQVLVEILPAYVEGRIKLREQEHEKATYTTLIEKDHGFIPPKYLNAALKGHALQNEGWEIPFIQDFTHHPSPITLERFIRALYPWPGAYTNVKIKNKQSLSTNKNVKRLKLLKTHIAGEKLVLDQVQLEGKNSVSWKQFKEGYPGASFN